MDHLQFSVNHGESLRMNSQVQGRALGHTPILARGLESVNPLPILPGNWSKTSSGLPNADAVRRRHTLVVQPKGGVHLLQNGRASGPVAGPGLVRVQSPAPSQATTRVACFDCHWSLKFGETSRSKPFRDGWETRMQWECCRPRATTKSGWGSARPGQPLSQLR